MVESGGSIRIGVLISGGGSNLQALIDHCQNGFIPGQIVLVISNEATAFGLERARRHGIATLVIAHRAFPSRAEFDQAMQEALDQAQVDLVCLAGFMRILTPGFVHHYHQRLLNIHPALLPAFPGLRVQARALASGARFSGATVQFVASEVDAGPIIAQAVVPILAGDTPESLAERILIQEHRLYPLAVRLFAMNRLQVDGQRVRILDADANAQSSLLNPPWEAC